VKIDLLDEKIVFFKNNINNKYFYIFKKYLPWLRSSTKSPEAETPGAPPAGFPGFPPDLPGILWESQSNRAPDM
jgi:hypothetical protein